MCIYSIYISKHFVRVFMREREREGTRNERLKGREERVKVKSKLFSID